MPKFVTSFCAALVLIFASASVQAADVAPMTVAGAETIDVATAKKLHDEGVLFVDLRMEEDFNKGHIPNAENLVIPSGFNQDTLEMLAEKDQPLVFYCYGLDCLRSSTASTRAISWGYTKVKYFRTGFPSWRDAGLPVDGDM